TAPRAAPLRCKLGRNRSKPRPPIWSGRTQLQRCRFIAKRTWLKDKSVRWRSGERSMADRSGEVSRDAPSYLPSKVVGTVRKAPRPLHLGVLAAKIPDWDRRGSRNEPDVGRQEKLLPRA